MIAIASDHGGYALKEHEIKILLEFRQSPLLENQIGEQVSQLYGKNTDPRTY